MASFLAFPPAANAPRFVDTGQGASGRLASWNAWTADPSPLTASESTIIWRSDDNMGLGGVRVPLGQGGCGQWEPFLDGFSNGATSGGDNCFYLNPPAPPAPAGDFILLEDGIDDIELEDGSGAILLET